MQIWYNQQHNDALDSLHITLHSQELYTYLLCHADPEFEKQYDMAIRDYLERGIC